MKSLPLPALLVLGSLVACSSTAREVPVAAPLDTTSAELTSGAAPACELTCEPASLTAGAPRAGADHHADAVANVDAVFAAMHDDLLACYRVRAAMNPSAHANVVLALVLNPDGSVRRVASTGGAMLGESGRRCLTDRVRRATFAAPHGGGTLEVEVPLEFRRLAPPAVR